MGVYLSSPVTDKDSVDEKCSDFVYGASSMQGWRISQEDAHNCIPNFYDKTSFFAVYDGHGGAEVAKYCEKHFPDFVKKLIEKNGFGDDIKTFIQSAFLEFDATLTEDDVIKELKVLAGKDDDNEEEEEGDPVGRTETDMLKEEANMPLDQLLAQYNTSPKNEIKNLNKKDFKSPFLTGRSKPLKSLKNEDENGDISSQTVSSTSNAATEDAEAPSLPNGIENLNNSNSQCSHLESANNATHDSQKDSKMENNNDQPSPVLDNKKEAEACSNSNAEVSSKCESSSQPVGSSIKAGGSSSSAEPSGSGSSCPGIKKSKTKAATEMATLDGDIETSDDDEDEDEEDLWEDMSDDDEDEDDEDEDEGQDDDVPIMDMSNDEPGSDSGCTACVCLLHEKKLIVANAGDSRCVLSRAGMAVELSFDHKPEDDAERARIQNAGGRVTSDGRVNGGLNLSRAIGDHVYKQNKDLPDRDQMITALPDVEIAELCEDDQFFVIACDGIWNYMSSQEVVDYILDKLKDPKKREKPSLICEELFDHCLAPNTYGDGTGCDNMTCIIVVLNNFKPSDTVEKSPLTTADTLRSTKKEMDVESQGDSCSGNAPEQACAGSIKRCSDNLEVNEGKRIKLGGEELF